MTIISIRPLLLQGDAKDCGTANFRSHDVEELVNVCALLDVVGEVNMGIVDKVLIWPGRGLCA